MPNIAVLCLIEQQTYSVDSPISPGLSSRLGTLTRGSCGGRDWRCHSGDRIRRTGARPRGARARGAPRRGRSASTPARSDAAAAAFGAEQGFARAAELVDHPAVEVVHICTPNALHVPLVEMALAAGKHVICEKPLATTARGCRRGLPLSPGSPASAAAVCFTYRFQPMAKQARDRVLAAVRSDPSASSTAVICKIGSYTTPTANWRTGSKDERPVAGFRRHRLALVRYRRVDHRPTDHRSRSRDLDGPRDAAPDRGLGAAAGQKTVPRRQSTPRTPPASSLGQATA